MKRFFLAGLGALACVGALRPAAAADLPVSPLPYRPVASIFTWTGIYLGAHVGGAWVRKDETAVPFTLTGVTVAPAPVSLNLSGFLAGGQVGANFQAGIWVVGVEAQASWASLTGSAGCSSTATAGGVVTILGANCTAKADALGTIAGRLGVAFDRLLVYGKAGAAWANDQYTFVGTSALPPLLAYNANETRWGWMLGPGVEYAFTDNWSAKLEYNYMDFGTRGVRFASPTATLTFLDANIRERIHLVKVGVNYRFGPSSVLVR
jgi:outer membrane immunogenic protein